MSVIYGFKFKRIACTCICVTFVAVLQVSLNAEENDNQPILRKYFRKWQSRPYQHKSEGQRSEKKKQKQKKKKQQMQVFSIFGYHGHKLNVKLQNVWFLLYNIDVDK